MGLVGFGFDDILIGPLSKLILQYPILGKILYFIAVYGDNFIYDTFMGGSVFNLATTLIKGDPIVQTSPFSLSPY